MAHSTYTLHYNRSCNECHELSLRTAKHDWLNRITMSTAPSPIGVPEPGEIVLVDEDKAKLYTRAYATRKICMNVPLYLPFGLLLYIPPLFNLASKNKAGCNGDSCRLKTPAS